MCDLADVEAALVDLIGTAVTASPPSAPGVGVAFYRGWPLAAQLDADMSATPPIVNVTVFPLSGMTRITTRYPREWVSDGPGQTALTATASGTQVTVGGAAGLQQLVGVRFQGHGYAYPATATDTPATTATALAGLIPGATGAGAVVTLPSADPKLKARVVGYATVRRELRRQVQGFRLTCWCPDRASRDAIAAAVDQTIAATPFLPLPDGGGRLLYAAADVDDVPTKDRLWRRDFRVTVEYPTTEVQVAPAMLWGVIAQYTAATDPVATI